MAKKALPAKKAKKQKTPVYLIDGLHVRNLKEKIKLVISKQDCARGATKAPNACAAALAAARQIPNCLEARVHINRIFLHIKEGDKEYWLRGKAPGALRTEIASFDKGGTFEPGVYDINPLSPSELAKVGAHSPAAKSKGMHNHKRRPPRKLHFLHGIRGGAHTEYRHPKK